MRTEQTSKPRGRPSSKHKQTLELPKAPDPTFEPDYIATKKDIKQLRVEIHSDINDILIKFRIEIKSDIKWLIGGLYALVTIGFIALGIVIGLVK